MEVDIQEDLAGATAASVEVNFKQERKKQVVHSSITAPPVVMSYVETREKQRTNLRRKITNTLKELRKQMDSNGPRTFIRQEAEELRSIGKSCREINDELCDNYHDEAKADEFHARQLVYSVDIAKMLEEAATHLALRADETSTIFTEGTSTPVTQPRGGQKIQDVVEYAREQQKTLEEAMVRTMGKTPTEWMESTTPKPRNMTHMDPTFEEEGDLQSGNPKPTNERIQRKVKLPSEPMQERENELSDDWIDRYVMGLEEPEIKEPQKGAPKVELPKYDGSPLKWFNWIGQFKGMIHDTDLTPEIKLTALSNHLTEKDRRLISRTGGGDKPYKAALKILKQICGRRDIIRKSHRREIEMAIIKGRSAIAFYDFALKIRTSLEELHQLNEPIETGMIDVVCKKIPQEEQDEWKRPLQGKEEYRTLQELANWVVQRALAKPHVDTLMEDRFENNNIFENRQGRTNQAAGTLQTAIAKVGGTNRNTPYGEPSASRCFRCGENHRLTACPTFKRDGLKTKRRLVEEKNLCENCLGGKHRASECRNKQTCPKESCGKHHHILLHEDKEEVMRNVYHNTGIGLRGFLGTTLVRTKNLAGEEVPLNILLDSGSNLTLMREGLIQMLGLRGVSEKVSINTAGGGRMSASKEVKLTVTSNLGEEIKIRAWAVSKVCDPLPREDWNREKYKWAHLAKLPLESTGGRIDILLGSDHVDSIVARELRVGKEYEPVAARTRFGWIVIGRSGEATDKHCFIATKEEQDLQIDRALTQFFATENYGAEKIQEFRTREEEEALKIIQRGTKKLEVGYEIGLPWKAGEPRLENNKIVAESRLKSLQKRFEKDPEFEKDYNTAIKKYVTEGYASQIVEEDGPAFYLPHHGVYKTTLGPKKLRVVFNAASRFRGKCLNDALYKGPAWLNQLPQVLIKFRERKVAFTADIEAMFSRIRLTPTDARYHRFLWTDKETGQTSTYQMNRLTFGDCCSPFVAVYATRKVAEDYSKGREGAADAIRNRLYMDDYLDSADTVEKAVQRAKEVDDILKNGDFHLTKWLSNNSKFNAQFQQSSGGRDKVELGQSDAETKILGVCWKPKTDQLTFVITKPDLTYTKRGLLSLIAGVFDPLGLAAPLITKAKIRLRIVGIQNKGWDTELLEEDKLWWKLWIKKLDLLNEMKIPRCLAPGENIKDTQLHIFSDASEEAFAAVVYLRTVEENGKVTTAIIMAKTKLAALKTVSVAKLELNAAVLGARLAKYVGEGMARKVNRRFFWTDSSCVRNWIRASAASYMPFVNHRIGEIQTITETQEWRFIPGKLNPSDLATRSELEEKYLIPDEWSTGPEFLRQSEMEWPKDLPWAVVKEDMRTKVSTTLLVKKIEEDTNWKEQLDKLSWEEVKGLKGNTKDLIKRCQEEEFLMEIQKIKKAQRIESTSKLLSLTPVIDKDGLLRVGGRIGRVELPYENRHPIILPAKHELTRRIVFQFHEGLHHGGTDFILAHVRQYFWVLHGRETVKRATNSCPSCIKERARPGQQLMGDLPLARLDMLSHPFSRTSVDYFGPLMVEVTRGKPTKRYGAIFTCLTTRAVYLDLAKTLSSEDFLLVLRRFVGLYGRPRSIHSDNGTNFVGAERMLKEEVQGLPGKKSEDFLKQETIEWHFQPPRAPHFGGSHESLVKSTKKILYRILDMENTAHRFPSPEGLQTLLFEVAGILNTRPLGYVSSDPKDFRPLRPHDFLNRPPVASTAPVEYKDALPKERYHYVQKMTNIFWDMWKKMYIQSLMERKQWKRTQRNLEVGDLVLLIERNQPRGQWITGRVKKTYPGMDNLVRVVDVETQDGVYRRAIHTLCLLGSPDEKWNSLPDPGRLVGGSMFRRNPD